MNLDTLEQDARSTFILHEHKPNRYYFDERGRVSNEPVGGYGYRDKLLAEDFLVLIERVRKVEQYLAERGEVISNQEQLIRQAEAFKAEYVRVGEVLQTRGGWSGFISQSEAINGLFDDLQKLEERLK